MVPWLSSGGSIPGGDQKGSLRFIARALVCRTRDHRLTDEEHDRHGGLACYRYKGYGSERNMRLPTRCVPVATKIPVHEAFMFYRVRES
jgi:hypothetical protein